MQREHPCITTSAHKAAPQAGAAFLLNDMRGRNANRKPAKWSQACARPFKARPKRSQ